MSAARGRPHYRDTHNHHHQNLPMVRSTSPVKEDESSAFKAKVTRRRCRTFGLICRMAGGGAIPMDINRMHSDMYTTGLPHYTQIHVTSVMRIPEYAYTSTQYDTHYAGLCYCGTIRTIFTSSIQFTLFHIICFYNSMMCIVWNGIVCTIPYNGNLLVLQFHGVHTHIK